MIITYPAFLLTHRARGMGGFAIRWHLSHSCCSTS